MVERKFRTWPSFSASWTSIVHSYCTFLEWWCKWKYNDVNVWNSGFYCMPQAIWTVALQVCGFHNCITSNLLVWASSNPSHSTDNQVIVDLEWIGYLAWVLSWPDIHKVRISHMWTCTCLRVFCMCVCWGDPSYSSYCTLVHLVRSIFIEADRGSINRFTNVLWIMRGDNTPQGSSCLEDSAPSEHLHVAPDVMQSWWASIRAIGGSFFILYCRLQLFSWLGHLWLPVAPLLRLLRNYHIAHLLNWPEKADQNPDFIRSGWGMKCLPCSFHELALKAFSCHLVY